MPSTATKSTLQLESHGRVTRAQLLMWCAASAFMLVLIGLIIGAPLAMSNGFVTIGTAIYKGFSPLCHQITERSFHLDGHVYAVCSRCTGIYAGFTAGVIFYPIVRSLRRTESPSRFWLVLAVLPMAADWSLGFVGVWTNTHASRFVTGAVLGVVCAFFVVPGLIDALEIDWRRFFLKAESNPLQNESSALPHSPDRTAPSDYSSPANRI